MAKRYSFWITPAQAAGLKLIKETQNITESDQIRRALNWWLRRNGALRQEQHIVFKLPKARTSKENNKMRESLGDYLRRPKAKLTAAQSREIRRRLAGGDDSRTIANDLGVERIQVAAVLANVKRGR